MSQLSLELRQYPRPIAWTISEVDRAVGDRDRRDMLFSAFEEILRYLVLIQMARYCDYWSQSRADEAVERSLMDLRKPSFGHYLNALTTLDQYLAEADDPFAVRITEKRDLPRILGFWHGTGVGKAKAASVQMLFSRVIELRNREKGHGYTGQRDARTTTGYLQPALIELLEKTPLLLERPLVWIESIEYVAPQNLTVTFLELMGTQRARRLTRQVHDPGSLRKGFLYMWDGESAPLQMTPFLHLEEGDQDEMVFVLSGVSRDPIYQTRGSSSGRRPDHLMSQLEERAPFLLKSAPVVTKVRAPEAERFYRKAVEIALADGDITPAEAERLDELRRDLGIGDDEIAAIHRDLGWATAREALAATMSSHWPEAGRLLATAVRDSFLQRLEAEAPVNLLDEDLDVRKGRLWLQLGRTHGIALSFPSKRADQVSVAVGFYSSKERADDQYRRARESLESDGFPEVPTDWDAFTREGSLPGVLALETRRQFALGDLKAPRATEEISLLVGRLFDAASQALAKIPNEQAPPAPIQETRAPVSASIPEDFSLTPLQGSPRLQGSVWLARILWALEFARRNDATPKSAADIARILQEHGVNVPNTNTARAFRTPQDDPRTTGLCDEPAPQRYVISKKGRRVLQEWLASAEAPVADAS